MKAERRIRTLLLGWLLVPLALVLAASAVASYTTALRIATEAYDRALLDPALAIAQRLSAADGTIELDLSPAALEALRVDSVDRVYFAISAGDRVIAGQPEVPPPPEDLVEGTPLFYDGTIRGEPVRLAAMAVPFAGGAARIVVAETLVKRERMVRQLLASSALPEVAFFVVALGVVWYGVGRGLAPLESLRAELARRAPRDLRPVAEDTAPRRGAAARAGAERPPPPPRRVDRRAAAVRRRRRAPAPHPARRAAGAGRRRAARGDAPGARGDRRAPARRDAPRRAPLAPAPHARRRRAVHRAPVRAGADRSRRGDPGPRRGLDRARRHEGDRPRVRARAGTGRGRARPARRARHEPRRQRAALHAARRRGHGPHRPPQRAAPSSRSRTAARGSRRPTASGCSSGSIA